MGGVAGGSAPRKATGHRAGSASRAAARRTHQICMMVECCTGIGGRRAGKFVQAAWGAGTLAASISCQPYSTLGGCRYEPDELPAVNVVRYSML